MRKLFLSLCVGVAVVASVAVVACVGDEAVAPSGSTSADGGAGGGTSSSSSTSGSTTSGGDVDDASVIPPDAGVDSGPAACSFQTRTYPCSSPPVACYGDAQTCTLTGCDGAGAQLRWTCNSPNQCAGAACCLPKLSGSLATHPDCSQGTLLLAGGLTTGTTCGAATTCDTGNIQLCQGNSQCPTGQRCVPVEIGGVGAPASMVAEILAVCAP